MGEVCRAHRSGEGGNRELVVLLALIGSVERIMRRVGACSGSQALAFFGTFEFVEVLLKVLMLKFG